MTTNEKKEAMRRVIRSVETSRLGLGLEEGSTKATTLSSELSDAWSSPKAEDVETEISTAVTNSFNAWSALHTQMQSYEASEPAEVEEGSPEARWGLGSGPYSSTYLL